MGKCELQHAQVRNVNINYLLKKVKKTSEEFLMAIQFHEVWKIAAYDENLHKRIVGSFKTHTLNVILYSLRRETLLVLMRLWDKQKESSGIEQIIDKYFRCDCVINAMANKNGNKNFEVEIITTRIQAKTELIKLVEKYSKDTIKCDFLKRLRKLRDEHLAHLDVKQVDNEVSVTKEEIESFYQDTFEMIKLLIKASGSVGYSFNNYVNDCHQNAKHFWDGVYGKKLDASQNLPS